MKTCLQESCGKEFEPNKPKQKFCSDICRVKYHRWQAKKEEAKEAEKKSDPLWEEFLKWKEGKSYEKTPAPEYSQNETLPDKKEEFKYKPLSLAERIAALEKDH